MIFTSVMVLLGELQKIDVMYSLVLVCTAYIITSDNI